jgi:hypothetical protein
VLSPTEDFWDERLTGYASVLKDEKDYKPYYTGQMIVRVLGSWSTISFTRKDYANIELRVPSVAKVKKLLGFEAKVDLEEGICRTTEYFK